VRSDNGIRSATASRIIRVVLAVLAIASRAPAQDQFKHRRRRHRPILPGDLFRPRASDRRGANARRYEFQEAGDRLQRRSRLAGAPPGRSTRHSSKRSRNSILEFICAHGVALGVSGRVAGRKLALTRMALAEGRPEHSIALASAPNSSPTERKSKLRGMTRYVRLSPVPVVWAHRPHTRALSGDLRRMPKI